MNIQEYLVSLPILFKNKLTPLCWGFHGLGKSTVPQQFADAGGHSLVNFRLGNVEAGELLGIPAPVTVDGVQVATQNLMPDWLRDMFKFCMENPDKYGIIHLDEINHIRKDMQSFIFQMALDFKLHTWDFPANVRVICSANPPTNDYSGVFDFSNKALLSRFVHLKFTPTVQEWLEFARGRNFDGDVIDYISMNDNKLDDKLEPFSIDSYTRPARRSWEFVSRLKADGASRELISGVIGVAETAALYQWLDDNKQKTIKPDEVINEYKKVQPRIKKLIEEGKIAALQNLSSGVQASILKLPESALLDMQNERDNLALYMQDLPPESAWTFFYSLIKCPAIHFGPDLPNAPTKDKEPGSVFGPHTYPELLEMFTKYSKLGIADKVKDQLEEKAPEPEVEEVKTAAKKKKAK